MNKKKFRNNKTDKKKRLMRPLYIEPVTSLDKMLSDLLLGDQMYHLTLRLFTTVKT